MNDLPLPEERALAVAQRVSELLSSLGVETAVIGAIALAVHGYPRQTADINLATSTDPRHLDDLAIFLRKEGYEPEVRHPDADDPLGGVVDIPLADDVRVQVVNFLNPIEMGGAWHLAREAIEHAQVAFSEESQLRVVTPPYLVALKLYAAGAKSRLDVVELLTRRPDIISETRQVCARFGFSAQLEAILQELGIGESGLP